MAAILNYLRLEFRTVPAPGPLGLNFICHDNLESMSESMHSIVFDWQNRLKMPRPDAYRLAAEGLTDASADEGVALA